MVFNTITSLLPCQVVEIDFTQGVYHQHIPKNKAILYSLQTNLGKGIHVKLDVARGNENGGKGTAAHRVEGILPPPVATALQEIADSPTSYQPIINS